MSSFCKFQHICVSFDESFNESLTNDIVSFEQLGMFFVELNTFKIIGLNQFKRDAYKTRDGILVWIHKNSAVSLTS